MPRAYEEKRAYESQKWGKRGLRRSKWKQKALKEFFERIKIQKVPRAYGSLSPALIRRNQTCLPLFFYCKKLEAKPNLIYIQTVLTLLHNAGLKFQPTKMNLFKQKVNLLGMENTGTF